MLPPTTHLPPIKHIAAQPVAALDDALQYLTRIYSPPVRGTRRRRAAPPASQQNGESDDDLRTDPFEHAYAIKWLTTLVARLGGKDDNEEPTADAAVSAPAPHARLVDAAAALLAACAGTAAAGVLTRVLVFPTSATAGPVRVVLTDAPLDNDDYGSVGAQTWGGACVLAEMIAEDQAAFGLGFWAGAEAGDGDDVPRAKGQAGKPPLRLLELGAGTGLVSLVLAALASQSAARVDIVATDYYPAVLENLTRNVHANFPASTSASSSSSTATPSSASPSPSAACSSSTSPTISTTPLDWSTFPGIPPSERPHALRAPFDVVFGADIIYEAPHAAWVRDCLALLLRKPAQSEGQGSNSHSPQRDGYHSSQGAASETHPADSGSQGGGPEPAFHLLIPLRATHAMESRTIEEVFPPARSGPAHDAQRGYERELALVIKEKQTIVCDTEAQGEEIKYAYYSIAWGCAA